MTPCEKMGMYTIAPNMAMVVKNRQQTDTTKTLFLNKPNDSIGFAAFLSMEIKIISDTRLVIKEPMIIMEDHPYTLPPQTSASNNGISVAIINKAPHQSMILLLACDASLGKAEAKTINAIMPMGIFT